MKRYSTKTWAAALVLAITAADCVGIYVAQIRLHRDVPVTAPEMAYADATAVKDTWRSKGLAPVAQRAFANTVTAPPAANAPSAPVPVAPRLALAPQRLAQAEVKVPAYKQRTDAFLAPPRLAETAPPARVELATEVHATQHRAAVHRASARLTHRDAVPPTSLSFAAAFGSGSAGAGALAMPEPSFGKQANADSVTADLARASTTATDASHFDMGDSATIGKTAPTASEAPDPELPAVPAAVQPAALPGS